MIDTVPRPDASLPELLAARARHASDTRLALDAVIGFVVLIVSVLWRGPGWHLFGSIAGCFFAFGVWGIADRELGERAGADIGTRRGHALLLALQITRVLAVIMAVIAVFVVLASALGIALGRMIS